MARGSVVRLPSLRFVVVVGIGLFVVSCLCLALLPRRAAASEHGTAVVVVNFPTPIPYPTQIAIPTVCATPTLASASPSCGVAAVTVGHTSGEGGLLLALLVVNVFGFGVLGVIGFVYSFVRR